MDNGMSVRFVRRRRRPVPFVATRGAAVLVFAAWVLGEAAPLSAATLRYAVLVGVSDYQDSDIGDLEYSDDDATCISLMLSRVMPLKDWKLMMQLYEKRRSFR